MKSIKEILNVILTFVVLFIATKYFPEYVHVDGTKELILTVLFMILMNVLYCIIIFLIGLLAIYIAYRTSDIFSYMLIALIFISALFYNILSLYIISTYYSGFEITGGWLTYLLLSLVLSVFTIKIDTKKNN